MLLRLIDISPASALALAEGEVDIGALLTRTRGATTPLWYPARGSRFADAFGHPHPPPRIKQILAARGVLDELVLLVGLVGHAGVTGTAAQVLLSGVLPSAVGAGIAPNQACAELRRHVTDVESAATVRPHDQQWTLYRVGDKIRFRPISALTEVNVIGLDDLQPARVRVHVEQLGPFFRAAGVLELEAVLNSGRDARDVQWCLDQCQTLTWLLGEASVRRQEYIVCLADSAFGSVLLERVDGQCSPASHEDESPPIAGEGTAAERLWRMRDWTLSSMPRSEAVREELRSSLPAPLRLSSRLCLLIGAPLPRIAGAGLSARSVTTFDLAREILSPAHEYLRQLELGEEYVEAGE
jgi:hypothetical protein